MNEHDKPRPVSGEIMTGTSEQATTSRDVAAADITDAEYETIERARQERPSRFSRVAVPAGMESLRKSAPETGPVRRREPGGALFWASGLTLVVLAFWVSGGHALVRNVALPSPSQTAQPLRLADIRSRVETHDGRNVLFVDGQAENHGATPSTLPPIGILVTSNDGKITRYFLGTNETELAPGGRYSFSSRLEAPTNGVKTVSVTFEETGR